MDDAKNPTLGKLIIKTWKEAAKSIAKSIRDGRKAKPKT
jgi:hypothetical protein